MMRDVRSIKMARSRRNCAAVGDGGVFGILFRSSILPVAYNQSIETISRSTTTINRYSMIQRLTDSIYHFLNKSFWKLICIE